MTLQRKKRHVRFGIAESIALVLLLFTLFAGVSWWVSESTFAWQKTVGAVIHTAYHGEPRFFGLLNPDIEVNYLYTAEERTYPGQAVLGPIGKILLRLFPPAVKDAAVHHVFVGMEDLPPNLRKLFDERGVTGFDRIPSTFLDALRAKGYTTAKDMPPELKDAIKKEDYATVAKMLDKALPPGYPLPADQRSTSLSPSMSQVLYGAEDGLINLVYDPMFPSLSRLNIMPSLQTVPSLAPFIFFAVLSLAYCLWGYPATRRFLRKT